jgi:two-component system, cell cycle sensor histidine kinase and response regulator CckA
VPIRTDDEVIGTLVLGRRSPALAFDAADQCLAEDLAARFAVCLSRSRILDRLQTELAERQRAEKLLEETEDQLRQARRLEAIGLLAGGIAHDFNNLLTVILGTTDLLSSEVPADHEWRPDLEAIATAGRSARDLTSQLLAFSRKQILQPTPLDANALVKQAELLLSRVIGEHVTLRLDLAPTLPALKADRGQLEQSLMNLAANARDAMPQGGTITLKTRVVELKGNEEQLSDASAGAYVTIAVSDTGQGIQDEARARLFEPFFTTKERGKGTGLGLAAVYGIVKQSAGHITVHSVVGSGTTFTIYLPAQSGVLAESMAPPEPVPNSKTQLATGQGQPRTILVVEDDAQVRAIVCRILGDHGYSVLTASTLDEASSLASRGTTIDLLLSDMVLTQSNGVAVAQLVRGMRPELKVLFMTGYADSGQAITVGEQLQGSVLHKPFTPAALLDRVRQVLADASTSPC